MQLAALIFDMDGTLFNTEPLHRKTWKSIFETHGVHLIDEEIVRFNGSAPDTFLKCAQRLMTLPELNIALNAL